MRASLVGLAIVAGLAGCTSPPGGTANWREPIHARGDYLALATCVYLKLDAQGPGLFQLTDLRATNAAAVSLTVHGGGLTIRSMHAVFRQTGPGAVTIDVEGQEPGYYPAQVRGMVTGCALA